MEDICKQVITSLLTEKFKNNNIAYQWESQRTKYGIFKKGNTRQQSEIINYNDPQLKAEY